MQSFIRYTHKTMNDVQYGLLGRLCILLVSNDGNGVWIIGITIGKLDAPHFMLLLDLRNDLSLTTNDLGMILCVNLNLHTEALQTLCQINKISISAGRVVRLLDYSRVVIATRTHCLTNRPTAITSKVFSRSSTFTSIDRSDSFAVYLLNIKIKTISDVCFQNNNHKT